MLLECHSQETQTARKRGKKKGGKTAPENGRENLFWGPKFRRREIPKVKIWGPKTYENRGICASKFPRRFPRRFPRDFSRHFSGPFFSAIFGVVFGPNPRTFFAVFGVQSGAFSGPLFWSEFANVFRAFGPNPRTCFATFHGSFSGPIFRGGLSPRAPAKDACP